MIKLTHKITEQVVELDEIGTFLQDIADPDNWIATQDAGEPTEITHEAAVLVATPVVEEPVVDAPEPLPELDVHVDEFADQENQNG